MAVVIIDSNFGYVVFVLIASWVLVNYLTLCVVMARKKYGITYPTMYSDTCHEFNCIQRAHQNTLEVYPQFLVFLILGGLQYPKLSALFGLVYVVSRLIYAHGYFTFKPANRNYGAFGFFALMGLMINTSLFGLSVSGFIGEARQ